jgi:hypothetical protein
VSGVLEQRGGNGGVHAARERNDDAGHGRQPAARRGARPASGTWLSISSG